MKIVGSDCQYFPINGMSSESSPHKYSRLIPLCQSIIPGKWASICLGIKNSFKMQNITIVQNGKTCLNRTYKDGNFGLIRLREKLSLQDMYDAGSHNYISTVMWNLKVSFYIYSILDGGETTKKPNGKITQLYLWTRLLSSSEMKNFASCSFKVNEKG